MLNHIHSRAADELQKAGSMQGWGKSYDTLVGFLSMGQERKLRQATLQLARIIPGEQILEVGCGTGTLSLAAKRQAGAHSTVCGIDIAPDMIETARQKAAKAGLDAQFQVGRIETIPYPDNQFDLVLSSLMLHHIPDDKNKQQGLKEIFRVLKPGGRLLIVDMAPPQNPHLRGLVGLIVGPDFVSHSVAEFMPLLEQAGFTNIKTGPTSSRFLAYLSGDRT
ncbi:MAG: methyltransferase domain-containing protein [Anaerolineaceae bacterium]|nr:methyltransferase domain-containing protein [Anaerolineaceae bacterium]